MKALLKQLLSHKIHCVLRKIYYRIYHFPRDLKDYLQGQRDEFTPPMGMTFIGQGNFKKVGTQIFENLKHYCDLDKDDRILDLGCGFGRAAVPLTKYLSAEGSYEGLDIMSEGIKWCQNKITPRHPNFNFQQADIYNSVYYPFGKSQAANYTFPYLSASFDVVFLTSVFTHMLPADVRRYLLEIQRVLKPGGQCMITCFLLNDPSLILISQGKSTIELPYEFENYRVLSKDQPEATIAYDEAFFRNLCTMEGLSIKADIVYGSWCGRQNSDNYQDMLILQKL